MQFLRISPVLGETMSGFTPLTTLSIKSSVCIERGSRFFYFSDDTFTANKKRVVDICKKIIEKELDITWNAISRVDYVTEEILYWMRKAGCIQISYGVESGSEKIRNFLRKKYQHCQDPKYLCLDPILRYHGPRLLHLRLSARKPANP